MKGEDDVIVSPEEGGLYGCGETAGEEVCGEFRVHREHLLCSTRRQLDTPVENRFP